MSFIQNNYKVKVIENYHLAPTNLIDDHSYSIKNSFMTAFIVRSPDNKLVPQTRFDLMLYVLNKIM